MRVLFERNKLMVFLDELSVPQVVELLLLFKSFKVNFLFLKIPSLVQVILVNDMVFLSSKNLSLEIEIQNGYVSHNYNQRNKHL